MTELKEKEEIKMSMKNNARKNIFANVPADKEFWLSNGAVVKNLFGLSESLESMDDYTFSQHVNGEKNDFSNWIKDVIGDNDLANKLAESKSRGDHTIKILNHFVEKLK
ncbi:MAG: hypothetical protein ABII01_01290 [Candidatus Woesearchaeota archaeon]